MLDIRGYLFDIRGYLFYIRGYLFDIRGYLLDIRGYLFDIRGYFFDIRGYLFDIRGYLFDIRGYLFDIRGYLFDIRVYLFDIRGYMEISVFEISRVDCSFPLCVLGHSTSTSECRLNATVYNHDVMIYLGFEMILIGNATLVFMLQGRPPKPKFYRAGNQRETFQLYYMGTKELKRNQSRNFRLWCQPRNSYDRCSIRKLVLLAYQAKYSDCAHR